MTLPEPVQISIDSSEIDPALSFANELRNGKSTQQIINGIEKANSHAKFIEEVPRPDTFLEFPLSVLAQKMGNQYSCNLHPADIIDFQNGFDRYMYVDHNRPDNGGDGLSWANAKRSIGEAIDASLSAGISTNIIVRAGVYSRFLSTMNKGSTKALTCNIALQAVGGTVVTGPFETLSWTQNSTYPKVYQTTRSNAQQVLNPSKKEIDGSDLRYEFVNSVEECAAKNNSWYTDDVVTYVHTENDAPASDLNARVFLSARNFSIENEFYVYAYGFSFVGGSTGAVDYTKSNFVAENCTFRYAVGGDQHGALIPRHGVSGKGGMLVAFDSSADFNSNDGFNFHASDGQVGRSLTVNCKGFNNGQIISGVASCNGLTNHGGGKSIDIGGHYFGSAGANVAIVDDDTEMWCFGTKSGNSGGDYNSISTGGFSTGGGNAVLYLENTMDLGTKVGVNMASGTIFTRNHVGTGKRVGNIVKLERS